MAKVDLDKHNIDPDDKNFRYDFDAVQKAAEKAGGPKIDDQIAELDVHPLLGAGALAVGETLAALTLDSMIEPLTNLADDPDDEEKGKAVFDYLGNAVCRAGEIAFLRGLLVGHALRDNEITK